MIHSDDDGLILPPRIAPLHVVIMPLARNDEDKVKVMQYCSSLLDALKTTQYDNQPIQVEIDNSDARPGEKAWGWVKKGLPIRLEVGMKEVEQNTVFMGRRDQPYNAKTAVNKDEFLAFQALFK